MTETVGVVLAAGAGRRYGQPKALVEQDGELLVDHAAATLAEGGCKPVVVVLGAAGAEVRHRARLDGAIVVDNPDWDTGMGSSLRRALAEIRDMPADAAVILLVDTPGVTPEAVRRLREHAGRTALAVATYGGEPGHPVLLGRAHWDGAAALAVGDVGARRYLAAHADQVVHVPCDDIADGTDLDTPAQPDRRPRSPSRPRSPRHEGEEGDG